jgi:hypothetical protein
MISYRPSQSVRLGQVAYAQPYPPAGLEWGQGWGRFAPSSPKVVLPKSLEAGGGVGYTSEGTVLSQQDVEELMAAAGGQGGGAPSQAPSSSSASGSGKFPFVAAAVAALAILGSMVA